MKVKLENIAAIQSGIYQKEFPDGDVAYLQVNDFEEGELRDVRLKPSLIVGDNLKSHILSEGDLLFAAKGTSNFCALYKDDIGKAVASSAFFVLRVAGRKVLPEFLCWFLNTPETLARLRSQAVGSTIPSITKRMLEELELHLPDIETQKKIIEVSRLQRQEKRLRKAIFEKRELVNNALLYKSIIRKD